MRASKENGLWKMGIYILSVALIVMAVWMSLWQFRVPDVVSEDADSGTFSAERAMSHLKVIASEPRPLGSEAHEEARDYLFEQLTELGLSPETQEKNVSLWNYSGEIENVMARISGEDSSAAILLTSHYDSVKDGPGAGDDGAAVAAMLETARILVNESSLQNDVILLFTDGEEEGLLGAQAFVEEHQWAKDVGIVLNFEAIGNDGPAIMFETSEGNDRLITMLQEAVPNVVANSLFYEIYSRLPNDTDLSVYKAVGLYGLNIGLIEGNDVYHSASDNIENLNVGSMQHIGEYMTGLVEKLGNMNLVGKEEGNRVYFNLIGHTMVSYLNSYILPLMMIGIVLFLLTFVHGSMRKKVSVIGTCCSFLLFLLMIGLAYVVGIGAKNVMPGGMLVSSKTDLLSNTLFVSCIVVLFILFIVIYHFAVKKMKIGDLAMGSFVVWLVMTIVCSLHFKGLSYGVVWPLLCGLIAMNIEFALKDSQRFVKCFAHIIVLLPILLITAPIIYLVYTFWSLNQLPLLCMMTMTIMAFGIPIFAKLNETLRCRKDEHSQGKPMVYVDVQGK